MNDAKMDCEAGFQEAIEFNKMLSQDIVVVSKGVH